MKLNHLLKPWYDKEIADFWVEDLKNDSRQIKPGDVFLAYPGANSDGRLYIEKAIAAGAGAIIYESEAFPFGVNLPDHLPCVPIVGLLSHLSDLALRFYDNPYDSFAITGITGTNGKTSIAYQLTQAHSLLGQKAAYIGTIGQGMLNQLQPLDNTTPDTLALQRLFSQYKKQDIVQVCMEVSSHALSQHRVDSVPFKQAIFTNLTQDHLDYHRTMDAYARAKARLFSKTQLEYAIINQDAAYQQLMLEALRPGVQKISYGKGPGSDVCLRNWYSDFRGTEIEVDSPWGQQQFQVQALGEFNMYNSLAIFSSLLASGYPMQAVLEIMPQLRAAPGRMELVHQEPYVFVDYAHTPDALKHTLITLQKLKKGNLWVVFGCGGDRDRSKRAIMGQVASLHADKIVVTSDNPRTEDPQLIINEIMLGIQDSHKALQEVQREKAIAYALAHAQPEDIILIAGKGHETYQQIGLVKHDFSDQAVVNRLGTSFETS